MKATFLLFVIILCFSFGSYGQNEVNYKYVDSLTYQLYLHQKWNEIPKVAKLGFKNDIDYFYLRMRKGIAESEEEKYIFALTDFAKALQFNEQDASAKSYYYFTLINAGRTTRANRFSRNFSENQKKAMGISINTFENADFFAGFLYSNNFKKNGSIDLLQNGSASFGEQLLFGNQIYLHGGAQWNFTPSLSLYSGFSYLNIAKRNRYQYTLERYHIAFVQHGPAGGYVNIYELADEDFETTFNNNINQEEIYLNGKLQLDKGWSVNLFANIIFIQLTKHKKILSSSIQSDTLGYDALNGRYTFVDFLEYDYIFMASDSSFVNWVTGFNLQKDFNFLTVDLGATYSKLNNTNPFQASLSTTYYPLGNFSFYGKSGLTFFNQTADSTETNQRLIFQQMLGVKLSDKIWIEGEFASGNLQNVNIKQASVVFNLPEKINFLAGLKLHIFVNKHIVVSLMYDFMDRMGYYFNNSGDPNMLNAYTTHYQTQNFIGGIKWIP